MDKKNLSLDFEMQIDNVSDLNKSFAKAECLIAYCGRNRNRSDIPKEVFEKALPSLKNVPIVARYDSEKDDFGSHDNRVIKRDGKINIVTATTPMGVVPESAKQWFETRTVNGEEKECLITECLLWKRQYGYEHIAELKQVNQSMEINIDDYTISDDGYAVVNNMEFEALTLLGTDVEPCFENASLSVFSEKGEDKFKKEFAMLMSDLKDEIKQCFENNEKGEQKLEENKELEPVMDTPVVEEPAKEEPVVEETPEVETEEVTEKETEDVIEEQVDVDFTEPTEGAPEYALLKKEFEEYKASHSYTNEEVDTYKEAHKYENTEYELLAQYKADKEAYELKVAQENVLNKYAEEIGTTKEFAELKASLDKYSVEALNKECIYIRGLYASLKESKAETNSNCKFSLDFHQEEEEVSGIDAIIAKYLHK